MSKIFGEGGLTVPNSALQPAGGGPSIPMGPTGALSVANQSLQNAGPATSLSVDDSGAPRISANPNLSLLPKITTPTFQQASTDAQGNVAKINPSETKGGKLLNILRGGLQGGIDAVGSGALDAVPGRSGFGAGVEGAINMPIIRQQRQQQLQRGGLENQMLQAQTSLIPFQRMQAISGLQKTQAEVGKIGAETSQLGAEQALKEAQSAAARYKEVGGALYDVSGAQPVPVQGGGQFIPATDQMAKLAGIPVGTKIPVETASKLTTMVNAGVHSVQAGGRSKLVDSTGKTIADLGASTPIVVNNMNNPFSGVPSQKENVTGEDALQGLTPEQKSLVRGVATYRLDPSKVVSLRNGRASAALNAAVLAYNPSYDQKKYAAAQDVLNSAVGGKIGDELNAFNTALGHADLLEQAARALHNGDNQSLNGLRNAFKNEFGVSGPITAQAIANAYSDEVTKMLSGGHMSDTEIGKTGKTLDPRKQSLPEVLGVLGAYKALAYGKLKNRQDQVERGMQGEANFPTQSSTPSGATHAVIVNGKTIGYTSDGKTMTPVQ